MFRKYMKKTQIRDALRNIGKQKVSWFSIVIISMLSVMAYLGIHFASHGIARNANTFYDQTHFRDIEIVSTLLISPDDIEAVRAVQGVSDVEGVYQTSGRAESEGSHTNVDVVSLTDRINTPLLLEGRLPEDVGECLAEQPVLESLGLSVGDSIRVTDAREGMAEHLIKSDFIITGVIDHPDHACWTAQVPGNRNLVVLPKAFDQNALDGCFMKAEIMLADLGETDRFSEEYETAAAAVMERLEDLRAGREELRFNEIKDQYQTQLDEKEKQLDDGRKQLESTQDQLHEAEEQLKKSKAELDEAEATLQEKKSQLDSAKAKLTAARTKLDAARNELKAGRKELKSSKKKLRDANKQLLNGYNAAEEKKEELRQNLRSAIAAVAGDDVADGIDWAAPSYDDDISDPNLTIRNFYITKSNAVDLSLSYDDAISQTLTIALQGTEYENEQDEILTFAKSQPEYEEMRSQYKNISAQVNEWEDGHRQYLDGLAKYNKGLAAYQSGLDEYNRGLAEYESGRQKYESGLAQYEEGKAKYDTGMEQYASGEQSYQDALAQYHAGCREYEDGVARLAESQAQIDSLDPCRWVMLDVTGNPSYLNIRNAVNNTADMGMTFALVFVLVGALVIYATVGRIIGEQRRLVGTTKALGLFNREIFAKYLSFGVSATVLGMLLGIAAGYFAIQRILLYSYGRYYVYGAGKSAFLGGMTLFVFLAGIALSSLAVWSACSPLMRTTATILMQEKIPEIRHKREGAAGQRKGTLYTRLILRNMRSDLKRVIVTVVSVAGCCALLVAGFTMRQSVMKALNAQFDEITKYDLQIRFDPSVSGTVQSDLEALLTDSGTNWIPAHASTRTFSVDGRLLSANLLSGNLSELDSFYARLDPEKDISLSQDGDGIWIRQRVSEMNGVSAGDTIIFYDSAMKPYEIPVAGVFRIYAGQEMIIGAEQYEKYFGKEPDYNAFFIMLNGADAQLLKAQTLEIDGVEEVIDIGETRALYQSLAAVLDLIALMFVVIAGLMAFFILLNLANMQLNQKKRELTIMRINGFTVREVKNYVLRETILSTALGIILGIGTGSLLGYQVIRLLEGVSVRFMRGVQWEAWVIGAAITVIYAVIIQAVTLRKVKDLKLTDLK